MKLLVNADVDKVDKFDLAPFSCWFGCLNWEGGFGGGNSQFSNKDKPTN